MVIKIGPIVPLICMSIFNWLTSVNAQNCTWQLKAKYDIHFDLDHENHRFIGSQKVILYNSSPDTLEEIFFHLYFNAFQPESEMDQRSQWLPDPDPRIGKRISKLTPDEIGSIYINKALHLDNPLTIEHLGTIVKIQLDRRCAPEDSLEIDLQYHGQVPVQIRRSGRNNREGIEYSMAQWYPKLCQYDCKGWHTEPYIAREFYGIFAEYMVSLTLDKSFCLGFTGLLLNPGADNCGRPENPNKKNQLTWQIQASNVHDFVWTADKEYQRNVHKRQNGVLIETLHQPHTEINPQWQKLPVIVDSAMNFIETHYGPYAYPKFSILQGGDGGMEYPMATLITGKRPLVSLVGVTIHELLHSWYQGMIATNEQLYAWMDEGFTSYVEAETINYLKRIHLLPGSELDNPQLDNMRNYENFIKSGMEESLVTPSDYFNTNKAYGMAAYSKGAICLDMLNYIVGDEAFNQGMLQYYWKFRFKHPTPDDFFRVMEKSSKMELDWFQHYFVHTTQQINYTIDSVFHAHGKLNIIIRNKGQFPIPIELNVKLKDHSEILCYIPLDLQRGEKQFSPIQNVVKFKPWKWTQEYYTIQLDVQTNQLFSMGLYVSNQIPDVDSFRDSFLFHTE